MFLVLFAIDARFFNEQRWFVQHLLMSAGQIHQEMAPFSAFSALCSKLKLKIRAEFTVL